MRFPTLFALLTAPVVLTAASQPDTTSPAAARQVIERYYASIDRGDFRTAYAMWENGGRASGKSFASFRQGFASTARSRVTTGVPADEDAGMSQRWIDIPVDVHATLKNGRSQHFRGTYTLHRVDSSTGAPASRTRWHISAAKLVAVR